jgi:hypothetical protein
MSGLPANERRGRLVGSKPSAEGGSVDQASAEDGWLLDTARL